MKTVSGKGFARLLEKHGWELKRVTGSHHVYSKSGNPARISVPIHGNASLKIGLLKHLLKLSGISEDDLWRPLQNKAFMVGPDREWVPGTFSSLSLVTWNQYYVRCIREKELFGLEEAVWNITGLPGSKLKLHRGNPVVGWPADITVCDPDKIQDLVSERLPARVDEQEVRRHPLGIDAVMLIEKVNVQKGEGKDIFAGQVTRQDLRTEAAPSQQSVT